MMMPERKPVTDDTALLHRIGQLSGDATWTTEELQDTLREGGVDPDRLVSRVLMDVQALLDTADDQGTAPPLLVALRQYTQLPPSAIAAAMEVPVPFLSVVSRHPRAVPTRWWRNWPHALNVPCRWTGVSSWRHLMPRRSMTERRHGTSRIPRMRSDIILISWTAQA